MIEAHVRRCVLLVAALICSGAGSALAQSFHVGMSLGVSKASQIHAVGEETVLSGSRLGPSLGAVLRVGLSDWFEIQGELRYSEKGFRQGTDFRMEMGYIEVPLLARVTSPPHLLGIGIVAVAGVAPARESSCSGRTIPMHIPELPRSDPVPLDCSSMRTHRNDLGLVLGGGLETTRGGVAYWVELRHTRGTRDIGRGFEHVTVRNRALSMLLGAAVRPGGD